MSFGVVFVAVIFLFSPDIFFAAVAAICMYKDTLRTFEVAATLGEEALGAYVISMAKAPSDVLAVKLMQASLPVQECCRRLSARAIE